MSSITYATSFAGQVSALDHASPNDYYRCFLTTNERSATKVFKNLVGHEGSNRVHIGCSGWQNFDLISNLKSNYAIIVDIAKSTRMIYQVTEQEIKTADNRQDFLEKVATVFQKMPIAISVGSKHFYREDIAKELILELNKPNSWLASDEKFEFIKKMFAEKRIVFLGVDFKETPIFSKINQVIRDNGLSLDTLYLSNVIDWLEQSDRRSFFDSINAVVNEDTQVIYSPDFGDF